MKNQAQTWLSQLKRSQERVENLMERITALEAQTTRITAVLNDIGGGGSHNPDRMAQTIAKLVDARDDYERELAEELALQQAVQHAIRAVPDGAQRQVLFEKYVLFHTFEQIAERMGISVRYAHTLHGYGLLMVKVPEK